MTITAEQREARKLAIGASDMAAILGLDPYRTSFDVWLEKTNKLDPTLEKTNQAIELGNHLENYVLDLAANELGEIERSPATISRPDLYMACNLDARTIADGVPVEAKTAGMVGPIVDNWGPAFTDLVPEKHIIQTHVQMICTEKEVSYIPALLGGRGFFIYRILENDAISDVIKNTAADFWTRFVMTDTPPDNSLPTIEVIKRIKRTPGQTVEVDGEIMAAVVKAIEDRKEAEEFEEKAKAALFAMMGTAEGATSPVGSCTYLEQSRTNIDAKRLRADFPDIAAKYASQSRYRVLRIKPK
jgi:putative phage-type endonuclease